MPIELQTLAFDPADARAAWRNCLNPAVFALYGAEAHFEPYIGRTPQSPADGGTAAPTFARHPRRFALAGGAGDSLAVTGSEFEVASSPI